MPEDHVPPIDADDAMREELATQLSAIARTLPDRINADPDHFKKRRPRIFLILL